MQPSINLLVEKYYNYVFIYVNTYYNKSEILALNFTFIFFKVDFSLISEDSFMLL